MHLDDYTLGSMSAVRQFAAIQGVRVGFLRDAGVEKARLRQEPVARDGDGCLVLRGIRAVVNDITVITMASYECKGQQESKCPMQVYQIVTMQARSCGSSNKSYVFESQ